MSMSGGYQPPPPGGGFQPPPQGMVSTTSNNDATIALVAGILSLVCCGFVAAIPAIIYGNRVRNDPSNPQQGFGTAGFIMGWISVALSLVGIVVWVIVLVSGGFSVSTY
ncbi:MAG: DUF4190 domain-containing protein [Candidatus Microthrix sp.]|nr:hypothetical protein [Candidatus Microthrix sp.]MBK9560704.1 DUF4190 domain-containing protein [Candidatus Microthrix sp.]